MSDVMIDLSKHGRLSRIVELDPRISSRSNWSDRFWEFDIDAPGYSAGNLHMSWDVVASPDAINQIKYLAALLYVGRHGNPPLKNTGAVHAAVGMRHLLRFMHARSYRSVSQLDASAFETFTSQIAVQLADPFEMTKIEDGDTTEIRKAVRGVADRAVTPFLLEDDWMLLPSASIGTTAATDEAEIGTAAAYTRLIVWRHIRDNADDMRRAGIEVPAFDAFRGTSVKKMAESLGNGSSDKIPPLPDLVAKPILEVAHRLICAPADDVIRLHDAYLAARDLCPEGETNWHRTKRLNTLVMNHCFTPIVEGGPAWRTVTDKLVSTDGAATVRDLVTLIRDAAVIVLQSDTGMRISEICSVQVDDTDDDEALPSCITIGTSQTQLNEHFFLHGRLSKGVRKPRAEKWLVGGRPCGTPVEPPAVRAVRVLSRLLRPWRRISKDPIWARQLLPAATDCWLPSEPRHVGQTIGYALTRSMQTFIEREVGLRGRLEELVPANPDFEPYVSSNGRCVRAHQWRKTFLRYLVRIDEDLLPAISQHFKHYSLAITEDGYMPKDPEMFEGAESVRTRETSRALYQRRFGRKQPLSRLDGLLAESRKRIEEVIGGEPFDRAASRLDGFVREHDLQFWFARHGGCLIDLNPEHARCHQQMGVSDWKPRSPNFATRNPETCLGCRNFSAGPETVGFWRDRYVRNQVAWVSSGYRPNFRVARSRAKQSAVVLRHLGQPLPLILARAPGRGKFTSAGDQADA